MHSAPTVLASPPAVQPNESLDDANRRALTRRSEAQTLPAYYTPLVVFAVFTALESVLPASIYPALYLAKICAVTASLAVLRGPLRDIRPSREVILPSTLVGLAVFVAWMAIDKWVPYPHLGDRVGFDPFSSFESSLGAAGFLIIRFYGLVLLVPVMEELFWRSFVLRYVTDPDFVSVPIGTFSPLAFWVVAGLSGVAHPEWLVAVISSGVFTILLQRTRSLFAVIVAHAVTNGALGLYIVLSRDWGYW